MDLHSLPPVGRATTAAKYQWVEDLIDMGLWPDDCVFWPFGSVDSDRAPKWVAAAVVKEVHGPPLNHSQRIATSCGDRTCVNPRHLSWGDAGEQRETA